MQLHFYKYQGTGNDFIIFDNRNNNVQLTAAQIEKMCHRRFGIGADGLMLLEKAEGFDFRMVYFNADGKEGTMCGNGGRCLVKFAFDRGILSQRYRFIAVDGPHEAEIDNQELVRLKMKDVPMVVEKGHEAILDTGSPHFVRLVTDVNDIDVVKEGREIRYSNVFAEQGGINVNFVEKIEDHLKVRTYERGVEDETFSCGTGVTAAALVGFHNHLGFNSVTVHTKGGKLAVEFMREPGYINKDIWLIGPATFVFAGDIEV